MTLPGLKTLAYSSAQANTLYQQACTAEYQNNFEEVVSNLLKAIEIVGDDATLYTKLAGAYTELGEYDKAIDVYRKVSQLKPDDAFIYISIGSILETQNNYKEALEAYQKAITLFPDYKYNYLNIANAQYHLKDYKSAIESYNKFLSVYSRHAEARESLAGAYLGNNMPEKAIEQYRNLYAINPNDFKDYVNYGIALYQTKNYEKAVEILEAGLPKIKDNVTAHVTLALSYQELEQNQKAYNEYQTIFEMQPDFDGIRFDYANLLADMNQNTEAIAQYNLYIAKYPENYLAYKNLGIVYKKLNNPQMAITNLEKSLAINPDDADTKKHLAQSYHVNNDYDNAIKLYDELLITNKNDYDTKYNKAVALHAQKKYDLAIPIYNELLKVKDDEKLKSNLVAALLAQGQLLLNDKNYTQAVEQYIKVAKINPNDSLAYYGQAKCYRALGQNEKAATNYEKAIALAPEKTAFSNEYADFIAATAASGADEFSTMLQTGGELPEINLPLDMFSPYTEADKEKSLALIQSGDNNFKSQNYDAAIADYQESLKLFANDDVTLLKIGNSYKLKNDIKNAINFYKKAIFVNPSYADGWFNLGLVYAEENNLAKAKESFYRVTALNPSYANAYYALAMAYEKENNNVEAVKNYTLYVNYAKDADETILNAAKEKIKTLGQ